MSDDRLQPGDPKVRDTERVFAYLDDSLSILETLKQRSEDAYLVSCLLKSSRRAYLHLRAGWHTDSTYVAWACRNLLELRIFAAYVVKSPTNRIRFTNDMTVDTTQSTRTVVEMAEKYVPGATSSDEDIVHLLKISDALKSVSGHYDNRYLKPTKEAEGLGLKDELRIHSICSKLVHPTAQSVFLIDCESQDERDALYLSGSRYLIELMNVLGPFIETLETGTLK